MLRPQFSPLKNLPIRWKLYLILASTSALFVIALGVGLVQTYKNEQTWKKLDQEIWTKQHILHEIQTSIGYGHGIHNFKNMVLRKDLSKYELAVSDFDRAIRWIDQFLELESTSSTEKEELNSVRKVINKYRENTEVSQKLILEGKSSTQIDAIVKLNDSIAVEALNRLEENLSRDAIQRREAYISLTRESPRTLIVIWIASLTLAFMIARFILKDISGAVDTLVHDANRVASGALDHKIRTVSKDELGEVGKAVDKMRTSLTTAIDNLASSNKDLEQYAYIVSHDLQEPLRKILAFGGYIKESTKGKLDEDTEFYLSRVLDSSLRMRTLIDDLLTYSRATKKKAEATEVDLNQVVKNVWSDLELIVAEKKAELELRDLPLVRGDRLLLRQLFQNLIHNSLKFSKDNETPVIEIFSEPHGSSEYVELHVKDNGIGFSQKYAERILVPFQRLHGKSEYPGSGIGLAICNRIVTKHGGNLCAIGRPGEGSEFKFNLPRMI